MTKHRSPIRHRRPCPEGTGEGGYGVLLALFLIASLCGAVVINYYLWTWIARVFDWPEIGFWWFVPITLVVVPLKFVISALFHFMFFGDDDEGGRE